MPAIAGIDDMNLGPHMPRDQVRCAALSVTHHEHVGMHGRKIVHCIEQCLSLGLRRGRYVEIDYVGREPLCRDFECCAGAGTGFEE